jgi:hypothetical protein
MKARLIASRSISPPDGYDPWWGGPDRLSQGRWQMQATVDARLLVLDEALATLHAFPLPAEGAGVARPDLTCVALAGRDRIMLVDPTGRVRWEVRHSAWGPRPGAHDTGGSCAFSQDGSQVWAVVPGEDGADDEWWVLDTDTGRVLDRARLGCLIWGSGPVVRHPDGRHLGVDLSGGYAHGWHAWGRWEDSRAIVTVRERPYEVLTDVHPSGTWYLTTPIEADSVTVRRFSDGSVEAVRTGDQVFDGDVGFDASGGYLDQDTIIAMEFEGSTVLLTAGGLEVIGVVDYPEGAVSQRPTPGVPGTWTTFSYETGDVQLWQLER